MAVVLSVFGLDFTTPEVFANEDKNVLNANAANIDDFFMMFLDVWG
nr:hypothetical protein [Mucilaginibacter sp. SP1R1]